MCLPPPGRSSLSTEAVLHAGKNTKVGVRSGFKFALGQALLGKVTFPFFKNKTQFPYLKEGEDNIHVYLLGEW